MNEEELALEPFEVQRREEAEVSVRHEGVLALEARNLAESHRLQGDGALAHTLTGCEGARAHNLGQDEVDRLEEGRRRAEEAAEGWKGEAERARADLLALIRHQQQLQQVRV